MGAINWMSLYVEINYSVEINCCMGPLKRFSLLPTYNSPNARGNFVAGNSPNFAAFYLSDAAASFGFPGGPPPECPHKGRD